MIQLINIQDVRNVRQLSKQINADSFKGYVNSVQNTVLFDYLKPALFTDFFNFLENEFTDYLGTFEIIDNETIKLLNYDATTWIDYSLRIDNDTFVIVENAVLQGVDTILTIKGYELPATATKLSYSVENKYINLLNGCIYQNSENQNIKFNGLRDFLSWNFLSSYISDGNLKQSDVGNINVIGDMFSGASSTQLMEAKSEYMQNSTREQNKITDFLNANSEIIKLWNSTNKDKITSMDFIIN